MTIATSGAGDRPALTFRGLDPARDAAIATWTYPGALAAYDHDGLPPPELAFVAEDDLGVVGIVTIDADARVSGEGVDADVLDMGWGMAPDRIRRGDGRRFVRDGVDHVAAIARGRGLVALRCAILDWNAGSLAVARAAGFEVTRDHVNDRGRFLILRRPVD